MARSKSSFPCHCRGTGIHRRDACIFCSGAGKIDWDIFIESHREIQREIKNLTAELLKLRREAKLAKIHQSQMDVIVDQYINSLEPAKIAAPATGPRLVVSASRMPAPHGGGEAA